MPEELQVDSEEIEQAWLVCFGDDEGWHPSLAAGLFFSYAQAEMYVHRCLEEEGHPEWCILRCLPFELKVINDITDPQNPPKDKHV